MQPPGRFGALVLEEEQTRITTFTEKPRGEGAWVNGGFFVLEPEAIDYIEGDATSWERDPLERLAERRAASRRSSTTGFWQPMDTLRDKMVLEEMWSAGSPPWKVW